MMICHQIICDYVTTTLRKQLKGYGKSGLNRNIRGYVGELLKGYTNLIELLAGSDDIELCEESSQQSIMFVQYQ